jgi:hypothetical protein
MMPRKYLPTSRHIAFGHLGIIIGKPDSDAASSLCVLDDAPESLTRIDPSRARSSNCGLKS